MKKLFTLCLICLLAMSAMAQSIAVMEFKAGAGISQADVDGISGIFTTYFRPSGYTLIERVRIDRIIEEQKMQRSSLTEDQMIHIGELLNVSEIVIGDVNVVMGQYNVDVRVVTVQGGVRIAEEGASFTGSSYRETMKSIAQKLAGQIAIGAGPTVSAQSSASSQPRTTPYVIYGYLKVFPNDLGTFESEPRQVISRLNESQQFGYGSWRLPTDEELALMRANNLIGYGDYMTSETKKGIVRLVTDKEAGVVIQEEEETVYVVVETMPEFPGGQQVMMKYIDAIIKYPLIAMEKGIQGRVICQFVVEKDGKLSNIHVERSSGDASLDKEAIRVINSMPKWKPGKQHGKPVRVKYTIPLNFRLQ